MSREYTKDEILGKLISGVWDRVEYWENEDRRPTSRDKLEGLAFSILSMLDGCSDDMPGFILAPEPCPSDKEFHQDNDENWWPENHEADFNGDLRCYMLHDAFYSDKHRRDIK